VTPQRAGPGWSRAGRTRRPAPNILHIRVLTAAARRCQPPHRRLVWTDRFPGRPGPGGVVLRRQRRRAVTPDSESMVMRWRVRHRRARETSLAATEWRPDSDADDRDGAAGTGSGPGPGLVRWQGTPGRPGTTLEGAAEARRSGQAAAGYWHALRIQSRCQWHLGPGPQPAQTRQISGPAAAATFLHRCGSLARRHGALPHDWYPSQSESS
jgi:hypothetical protein